MQKYHKTLGQRTDNPTTAQAEQDISQHAKRGGSTVHRAYLTFATVALGAALLLSLAGCQTPTQPTYNGAMVPPPATGTIGQPGPYGPVGAPQVSYAQTPMPGPASTWQGATPAPTGYPPPAAPTQPVAPGTQPPPAATGSAWNWSQSQPPAGTPGQPPIAPSNGATAPPATAPPATTQQPPPTYNPNPGYGTPPPTGYQQPPAGQPQPWTGQYPQGSPQAPQQQTTNGSWWPFSDPNAVPPARATPASMPRY